MPRVLEHGEDWHHHMVHLGVRKQARDMQQRFEIVRDWSAPSHLEGPNGLFSVPDRLSRGNHNGHRPQTNIWRACPWTSSPCPQYTSERNFSIVCSSMWTDTTANILGCPR